MSPGIKVPTEWGKPTFDSLNNRIVDLNKERDEAIQKLDKNGASAAEIEKTSREYQDKVAGVNKKLDDFLNNHPLKDKVGVFEGANYTSKGFYRPTLMSLMHKFSEHELDYRIVNEQAIISAINYFTGN